MILLNGNQYKLCLVDTNVISEMVKNPDTIALRFYEKINPETYIPCFSLFTILELRKSQFLYQRFLELFSLMPCIIVKSLDQLFNDEINFYPNSTKVSPILVASPGAHAPQNANLKDILELTFNEPNNRNSEQRWNDAKLDILNRMLSLIKNYPPKNGKYTRKEIRSFIQMAGSEQIIFRSPDFARSNLNTDSLISVDAFPSIKIISFIVFYKFYIDKRRALDTDPFDIIISSSLPYLDAFFTEGHQSEILKRIKQQDQFINQLEVHKLKDLRE